MRALYVLTIVSVVGALALSAAITALDPHAPLALVAVYNLWLLVTVTLLVATALTLCFRFFSLITGGDNR